MHLSAEAIDAATIQAIESIGFVEDHFSDCRNCSPSFYHATYRGESDLEDEEVWRAAVRIVKKSEAFSGILEFEECVRRASHDFATIIPGLEPATAGKLDIQSCPSGTHKACDVHIRTYPGSTPAKVIEWLDGLGIASFDREREGVPTRVYTATFDTIDAGDQFLATIEEKLLPYDRRTIAAKLEKILDFVRTPVDATTLPITYQEQLEDWLGGIQIEKREGILR